MHKWRSRFTNHPTCNTLGVNEYKEVLIETVDSDVVVLSFGYAKIVKDAGVDRFSVVYEPKEKHYNVFDNLDYFRKTWMKQHNNNNGSLTRTFIHLGDQPTNIDPNDINIIAKYIYNCYGLDTSFCVYTSC